LILFQNQQQKTFGFLSFKNFQFFQHSVRHDRTTTLYGSRPLLWLAQLCMIIRTTPNGVREWSLLLRSRFGFKGFFFETKEIHDFLFVTISGIILEERKRVQSYLQKTF